MQNDFDRITIIGLGLLGGSLAATFRRKGLDAQIIGVGRHETLDKARSRGLIDEGFSRDELDLAVQQADLIFLATPINTILSLLESVHQYAKPGALVTDVGSTKSDITHKANRLFPDSVYFIGGHPMAGSEKAGVENADALLFESAIYVLTNTDRVPSELCERFTHLVSLIGAQIILLSPQVHDELIAVVSHLPQLISITLMNYAAKLNEEDPNYLKLAAGGFRDLTRLASSQYEMWADIFQTNEENIDRACRQFMEAMSKTKELVVSPEMEHIFEHAGRNRLAIPQDSRGFLKPFYDVAVIIEDKPGIIAEIAGVLAEQRINIKDIEILKIREGDAGNLRVSFESRSNRKAAIELLVQRGFEASERN